MPSLIKARGLATNNNELTLDEGSLLVADNVNIDQNDSLIPRRGFNEYGDSLPEDNDRTKQLLEYKNRLFRHFDSTLQFDSDGAGTFSNFDGEYEELETGLRIKYIEANSNFYFTTLDGIKKISATSASGFSTAVNYIKESGVARGLDIQASLNASVGAFLEVDNQVAYRIVWGYIDANNNLLLGAPSERTVLINPAAGSTSNVELTFTVPETCNTTDFFYQIYRTGLSSGESIDPGDEMNLVFEEQLTSTDISNGYVNLQYEDYPESFRVNGNLLYTNEISGDGILQSNNKPPVAKDITEFKESVFYSNTKTLHTKSLTMISAADLTAGTTKFLIGNDEIAVEYTAETAEDLGAREFKKFTVGSVSQNINDTAKSLIHVINRDTNCYGYATIVDYSNLALDSVTINGTQLTEGTDWTAATDNDTTAESLKDAINNNATLGPLVTATRTGAVIKIQSDNGGVDYSYIMSTTDTTNITIDSRLKCSPVVAYYTSGSEDLPGIISFEAKTLSDTHIDFGITSPVGNVFNPVLSESIPVSSITTATLPVVTTSSAHGRTTGDIVYLSCETSTPIINNSYKITVINATSFSIIETLTVAGTSGYTFKASVFSDNEDSPNRLYFSKTGQPEAVPSLNYIDIGARDSGIKRITALRDNLFVIKEDSIYVVSGSSAPNFSTRLLDNTITIKAADSAVVLNNQIFVLTNQGVATVSDVGVGVVSRAIEDQIFKVTNDNFDNYDIYTFGVGYESERSYHLWLPTTESDTTATQCFRYNTFNQTWTRWIKNCTCGVVNEDVDKLYLGDSDNNFIVEERKDRSRSDYADLEYDTVITLDGVDETEIQLTSLTNSDVGDVLYQLQWVTISRFNRLLKKLDLDIGLDSDYYSTLEMSQGDTPYTYVENLMIKLTADDSGQTYTYDSPSTFAELKTTYNGMITKLNASASDSFYTNYESITTSVFYEAVILAKSTVGNLVTVSLSLPFLEGPLTIYKSYDCTIKWAPQHFGDPSLWKQIREGTIFFDGNSFTNAFMGFSTDYSPSIEISPFNGLGIGTFGFSTFGATNFGGEGTDRPIRLLVPRQKQRCRYIYTSFEHKNAREAFKILGLSYTMRQFSSRAYKGV